MVFKKKPAGSQRTFTITIRLRPQVKSVVQNKIEQLKRENPGREFTVSEIARLAIWEFCKDANDPREP